MKRIIFRVSLMMVVLMSLMSTSHQVIQTKLKVHVISTKGEVIQGAKVQVFENQNDYNKHVNAVGSESTDAKGNCRFFNLKPQAYYIIAEKGDMSNMFHSDKTKVLNKGKTNKIIVVIE